MMLIDTSALYVLLDADDADHARVRAAWDQLRADGVTLSTTNYVAVETTVLCQRRLGLQAVSALTRDLLPSLDLLWVDRDTHTAAVAVLLAANRRDLSLVVCVSFEIMRRLDIGRVFTLDQHFRDQGFEVLP